MSLRSDEALYHVSFKIGQRSAGRSAVAAAAYRAGQKLHDRRTGRTFSYRKDEVREAFVLAPQNAPDWTQDRSELWSRAELAERRRDAQTWRELEISIPRDIPADHRRALIEDVVAPYVAAGAVVDIAIHEPQAADQHEQPHAHAMMSLRKLDQDREHGFASKKNTDLAVFFEGKNRRDGIRAERERIAGIINHHLAEHGSHRRADHRSYRERGDDRTPEPKIGERAMRRHHRHREAGEKAPLTDVQRAVVAMRHAKIVQHQVDETDHQIGKEDPMSDIKQATKAKLLSERFPGIEIPDSNTLHMVDIRHHDRTRVQLSDGGWVESSQGGIRIYKQDTPAARELANALAEARGLDAAEIEWMPAVLRARGPDKTRCGNRDDLEALADRWRERGYTDVATSGGGCWVHLGQAKILDTGNQCVLHGRITDDAIAALCDKAENDWNGVMRISGSDDFKERTWLEAQRRGVMITNYTPPPHLRRQWEREHVQTAQSAAATAAADAAVDRIADSRSLAQEIKSYASGQRASLSDPVIQAALDQMDDKQRAEIASGSNADILIRLRELKASGAAAPVAQTEPDDKLEDEPEDDRRPLSGLPPGL